MRRRSTAAMLLPFVLLATSLIAQTDMVEFTIVDRISFDVPGSWPVIASKSTQEKTVFAFQIPNAADDGTPDSSNLSIISTALGTAQGRDAFQKAASTKDHKAQERNLVDGWGCSTFTAMQRSTQYVIWDCNRTIGDSGVTVRVAWPHLPKNPNDYDKQMETTLTNFLRSVGPFKGVPKSGVLRRPNP